MDVLEIDAASHTGIDNIREVVHRGPRRLRRPATATRSSSSTRCISSRAPSFNALLKSIEEPPAHVVFMMATTELHKIPDTILSRSQVFEFRAFPARTIVEHLKRMVKEEGIDVPDAALALIARAAEGSMRDAQSALDQVMAFAGTTITVDDVSTVLGLVGRDLLFELIEAVIAEDGPARVRAGRPRGRIRPRPASSSSASCRKVVRDMMMVSVDPSRAGEGDLAEGEIERLTVLAKQFSREDLMRAFELLAKAEQDIRTASHPRYHIEMVLLRWMHLRKLVPLVDLLEGGGGGAPARSPIAPTSSRIAPTRSSDRTDTQRDRTDKQCDRTGERHARTDEQHDRTDKQSIAPASDTIAPTRNVVAPARSAIAPATSAIAPTSDTIAPAPGGLKDKLLAEIRSTKSTLYNLAVAQAQRIDVTDDRITFTFAANQNMARGQLDQNREWLESVAHRLAGRRIQVTSAQLQAEAALPCPRRRPRPMRPSGT